MDSLAQSSRLAYRELLETDGLCSFTDRPPIDAIERSRIGSRQSGPGGPLYRIRGRYRGSLAEPVATTCLGGTEWVRAWKLYKRNNLTCLISYLNWFSKSSFLRYVFYNAESSLASSDSSWMSSYAELVEDEKLRGLMLGKILAEEVWPNNISPKCSVGLCRGRPRFWKTLQAREDALRLLPWPANHLA